MNIECNTVELADAGVKLNTLLDELQTQFDKFFKKIEEIPVTGEWVGKNASSYCDKVYQDLNIYTKFVQNMKDTADLMIRFSEDTDAAVKDVESLAEESNPNYY